jgi:hypothetical protein
MSFFAYFFFWLYAIMVTTKLLTYLAIVSLESVKTVIGFQSPAEALN